VSRKHHPPSSILDFHIHEDICHPRKSRTSDFRGMHTLVYMLKASMPGNREHPISGVDRHWSMCPRHQLPEIENIRFPGYTDIALCAQGINCRKSRTSDFRGRQTLVYMLKASMPEIENIRFPGYTESVQCARGINAGNREHPISGVYRNWYMCSRHQCRKSRTPDFRGIQSLLYLLKASIPGNREHPISGSCQHTPY
jgi:hypothetical protein